MVWLLGEEDSAAVAEAFVMGRPMQLIAEKEHSVLEAVSSAGIAGWEEGIAG